MRRINFRSYRTYGIVVFSIGLFICAVIFCNTQHRAIRKPLFNKLRLEGAFYDNKRATDQKAWKYIPLTDEDEIKKELDIRLEMASEKKIIVLWSPAIGNPLPRKPLDRWKCGECEVTYNKSLIDDPRTGALVHHFDSWKLQDMPKTRNPNHLHIFWSMESSATLLNAHYTLIAEDEYGMNATMTYRLDSDFMLGYESLSPLHKIMGQSDSIYQEILKRKEKLAISVISDCMATPGATVRLQLINDLKDAGLRIDTFGSCFSNHIAAEVLFKSITQYKFYFAYENSYHSKDYITEKFFRCALSHNSVPVVWGATKSDYETIAPPGSFIFAEEFSSPKHLISYLEFLDKNDNEYLQFFRWRTMKPEGNLPQFERQKGFCAVCRALHGINADYRFNPKYNRSRMPLFSNGIFPRVLPSLRHFMYVENNPECFDVY